jgi:hypothetical protein
VVLERHAPGRALAARYVAAVLDRVFAEGDRLRASEATRLWLMSVGRSQQYNFEAHIYW